MRLWIGRNCVRLFAAAATVAVGVAAGLPAAGQATRQLAEKTTASVAKIEIAPHRAFYTMRLDKSRGTGDIVDGRGVMVFEWAESCDSWEIHQRMGLTLDNKGGRSITLDVSYTSTESKDGLKLQFSTLSKHDGEVTKDLRGSAELDSAGGGGEVRFTRPRGRRFTLPKGAMFPTAHTLLLIAAAKAGKKHVTRTVFDGDNDEGPYEVSVAINQNVPADAAPRQTPLADQPFWRMRWAYFEPGATGSRPESEISLGLQENGVARELVLDYGDYAVTVTLERIEALPRPKC